MGECAGGWDSCGEADCVVGGWGFDGFGCEGTDFDVVGWGFDGCEGGCEGTESGAAEEKDCAAEAEAEGWPCAGEGCAGEGRRGGSAGSLRTTVRCGGSARESAFGVGDPIGWARRGETRSIGSATSASSDSAGDNSAPKGFETCFASLFSWL